MSKMRKFYLVPHTMADAMPVRQNQVPTTVTKEELLKPPEVSEAVNLKQEIEQTLGDKETHPSIVMKKYEDLFHRFQQITDNMQPKMESKQPTRSIDTPYILSPLDAKYQQDASNLLKIIAEHPDIVRWTSDGSILVANEKIPGSNIAELIGYVFRTKKTYPPPALFQFSNALGQLPLNKRLSNILGSFEQPPQLTRELSPEKLRKDKLPPTQKRRETLKQQRRTTRSAARDAVMNRNRPRIIDSRDIWLEY